MGANVQLGELARQGRQAGGESDPGEHPAEATRGENGQNGSLHPQDRLGLCFEDPQSSPELLA